MFRRPTGQETEEDLLRYQEEFLRSNASPAATLIKRSDKRKSDEGPADQREQHSQHKDVVDMGDLPGKFSHTSTAPPVKKSKFLERKEMTKRQANDEDDPEERLEKHDRHITKVLSEIVERDFKDVPIYYPSMPAIGGFPTPLHRGSQVSEGGSASSGKKKKKSLFAQQFARSSVSDFGLKEDAEIRRKAVPAADMIVPERTFAPMHVDDQGTSTMLTGDGLNIPESEKEVRRIHEENQAKMATMTEKEILAEQQKLLEMMDPSLIEFFKSQRPKKTLETPTPIPAKTGETEMSLPSQKTTEVEDLPVKPEKDWVNMDQVEAEKLEWMKDLPVPPKTDDKKTGHQARFDFSGQLIAEDSEVPTHLGLHHHGKEPERAGYSLEELFQLARSANIQQRVLALNIIAKIITSAREGRFYQMTSVAIIPALVEGGLVFILRWALDDTTENSMAAAVNCLHALVVLQQDENGVDRVFSWHQGSQVAAQTPAELEEDADDGNDEDKPQQTDADVIKQDLVKGLLRMQLLQRLRYLLEVWRPAASVVVQILQILTRLARHSTQTAYQITQCPRLMDTVVREFLPSTWQPTAGDAVLTSAHGYPVSQAVRLIRCIACAGRNMAASLLSKYSLMSCISRYLAQDPSMLQFPLVEARDLQLESLRLWQVYTSYGLASASFSELYPLLTGAMQWLSTLTSECDSDALTRGCATLSLLESMLTLAASTNHLSRQHATKTRSESDMEGVESHDAPPIPEINWSHVTGLLQPIEMYMERWLKDFVNSYQSKKFNLSFVSCCMNFVATYLSKSQSQPGYNAVENLEHVEKMSERILLPVLQCVHFKWLLKSVRDGSVLLCDVSGREDGMESLPELGSLVGGEGRPCPTLDTHNALPFILALSRLLLHIGNINKALPQQLFKYVLCDEEILLYLRKCCLLKHTHTATNHFAKFDNLLQYHLLLMARLNMEQCDSELYHQVALKLLVHLHEGDEYIAHDLLSNILFNRDFIGKLAVDEDLMRLQSMDLSEKIPLSMASQQVVNVTQAQLTEDIMSNLAPVRATYLTAATGMAANVHRSRSRNGGVPCEVRSLCPGVAGQLLVPVDWVFMPLLEIYNSTTDPKGQGALEANIPPATVARVRDTLRWTYFLECWRGGVLDGIPFTTKLCRIMCTFLAGSDLFLDTWVHAYLSALFRLYCRPVFLDRMDFTKTVPGLSSFYDFYMLFLGQYEAVSFGDSLFGCYVLLPLQQRHSVELRRSVWGEHSMVLRALNIPVKQVIIPIDRFLEPEETNLELLRYYFQSLFRETVSPRWSPLLYLIAIHHVNRFFYTTDGKHSKIRMAMIQQILHSKKQPLQHHLLYYKSANIEEENSMDLYEELPSSRQQTIDRAQSSSS